MVLYSCCLFYLTDIDAINDGQSMCNRHEVLRLEMLLFPVLIKVLIHTVHKTLLTM